MWRQLLYPRQCIGIYTMVFVIIWLSAWVMNGIMNTLFDLDRLLELYAWLMTQLNVTHAVNSIWNSPKGVHPRE